MILGKLSKIIDFNLNKKELQRFKYIINFILKLFLINNILFELNK